MATPEGQARNQEVFRTAAELMVQRGYAGSSMGDLARATGMTKAGLCHHIGSQQDMLFQIPLHAMESLEREVTDPAKRLSDPEERLRLGQLRPSIGALPLHHLCRRVRKTL